MREMIKKNYFCSLPLHCRTLGGFFSVLTSSINSTIFSLAIYEAVLKSEIGYPDAPKIAIMVIGPLISALHFINASSVLTAIFSKNGLDNKEEMTPITVRSKDCAEISLEREMYGDLNVLLRSMAGLLSCLVICLTSLMFTWVIHLGIIHGKGLPDFTQICISVVGPILTSWSFMRANTTIAQIMNIETFGAGLRRKVGEWLLKK